MTPTRMPMVAGNWKMNGLIDDATRRVEALLAHARAAPAPCEIAICPPATLLRDLMRLVAANGVDIRLGGQDCATTDVGAHTGDISAPMLADAGCRYVIVGHSERRADHGETDATVQAKAAAARAAGLVPIVCVGETEAERDRGATLDVVDAQLAGSVPDECAADAAGTVDLVVAYEPVWAIGTGRTPGPADIAEVHGHLRAGLGAKIGASASAVRLLYGGSVKPDNAAAIFGIDNVDGALVGGASLNAEDFWTICEAWRKSV